MSDGVGRGRHCHGNREKAEGTGFPERAALDGGFDPKATLAKALQLFPILMLTTIYSHRLLSLSNIQIMQFQAKFCLEMGSFAGRKWFEL